MPLMWQEQSLQMEWCLDCHRNPERYVRPREAVFRVDYVPPAEPDSSSASGWSPSTRFRSSRAARRATDDDRHDRTSDRAASIAPSRRSRTAFWRTLDELAGDPAFRERLHNEFPSQIEAITDPVARRDVPEADGRVARARRRHRVHAAAGGERSSRTCASPKRSIPGKPLFFATAMPLGGVATGLLVESHEGRPTKIEGNPLHPGSLGATDVFAQAADPRPLRSRSLADADATSARSARGRRSSARSARRSTAQQPLKGAGLRILTESVTSPTLAAQIRELLARYPGGEVASVGSGEPRQRARRREARVRRVRRRAVPLRSAPTSSSSLDADFLGCGPGSLRYARDFAARRRPEQTPTRMNRLYAVESMPTVDRRARRSPAAAAAERDRGDRSRDRRARRRRRRRSRRPDSAPTRSKWVAAVAKDLQAHRGASLGHRRRRAAAGRPRARARDERGARQRRHDGRLHRPGRGRAGRSARSRCATLVADMDAGTVDAARHPRRQPGLHRAGRSRRSPTR